VAKRVAVVGSREGANEQHVRSFLTDLYAKYPDAVLVSGGAVGVDTIAETHWLGLGGRVKSYRPAAGSFESDPSGKVRVTSWYIEVWELGGDNQMVYPLQNFPTFENYKSACLARDTLISEDSDPIVSFQRPGGSRGASFTLEWREDVDGKRRFRYGA